MNKGLLITLLALVFFTTAQSQSFKSSPNNTNAITADNSRSDTLDILNYTINLDLTNISGKTISGNCEITFTPKLNNISEINLDLLKLSIDSIQFNNIPLNYTYNDTLLKIQLSSIVNINDTENVVVYYHGSPQQDASGWGGFYFQSGYAYNLGVGFDANPHCYGRVWFPCFDNFIERSTYTFNIVTDSLYKAFCNGELIAETNNGNATTTWTWEMKNTMPTYLASLAVAKYTTLKQTYYGIEDTIPIEIAAIASDTTKIISSFINLTGALNSFETHYGPYRWNRVGYAMVPFSSGAMEHATNIAYPKAFVDGKTTYETLYAHELSHHWWGDLVTCETAEDMWLNEGMATFSEYIFSESLYGKDAYLQAVNDNHEHVIHYLYYTENGYKAISGVSQDYTYSEHVYNKGADVAHTLRGYLGDSLYFGGLTAFLNTYQFTSITSYTLRDFLSTYSGINLTPFFDNWVFSPGFPHFSVDSFAVTPNGNLYNATVYIKQKLRGAPSYYTNVPLDFTFKDQLWNSHTISSEISGDHDSFTVSLSFNPTYIGIDLDDKISDAITSEAQVIKTAGDYDFGNAHVTVNVQSISDSAYVRIEHNWAAPDSLKNTSSQIVKLSDYRYWRVDGLFPSTFQASAKIYYNGKASTNGGYLDMDLISTTEDSLMLVYRKNAADDWKEFPYYIKNYSGSHSDKYGYITIDSLMKGEYAFAIGTSLLGIKENNNTVSPKIDVYPNPASTNFTIDLSSFNQIKNYTLLITDSSGKMMLKEALNNNNLVNINSEHWARGNYFIQIKTIHKTIASTKILLTNN